MKGNDVLWEVRLRLWRTVSNGKKIVRDPMFLKQKSEPATEADGQVIQDLLDTLKANQ